MEKQSVISWVSAVEGCLLSGVLLYLCTWIVLSQKHENMYGTYAYHIHDTTFGLLIFLGKKNELPQVGFQPTTSCIPCRCSTS